MTFPCKESLIFFEQLHQMGSGWTSKDDEILPCALSPKMLEQAREALRDLVSFYGMSVLRKYGSNDNPEKDYGSYIYVCIPIERNDYDPEKMDCVILLLRFSYEANEKRNLLQVSESRRTLTGKLAKELYNCKIKW